MLGNEAVARGLYEAGCRVVSSYPGTPSTEITEISPPIPRKSTPSGRPNEKVAAGGGAWAPSHGRRAQLLRHEARRAQRRGRPALIPRPTPASTAVWSSVVADDPGMHSSQNEQDSRHHAIALPRLPMLEPLGFSQECLDFTKLRL